MAGKSPLEKFPDYVHTIGMLAIEMGNLEAVFVQLLAAILWTSEGTAAAILMTPKSTRARLDMVTNIATETLPKEGSEIVNKLVKQAIAILNKRNDIIHEIWGTSKDFSEVVRIPPPYGEPKHVPLNELTNDVERLRTLADEVHTFRLIVEYEIRFRPHYQINVFYQISPESPD